MHNILSQSVKFCRLYIKNILVCFSVHSVDLMTDTVCSVHFNPKITYIQCILTLNFVRRRDL